MSPTASASAYQIATDLGSLAGGVLTVLGTGALIVVLLCIHRNEQARFVQRRLALRTANIAKLHVTWIKMNSYTHQHVERVLHSIRNQNRIEQPESPILTEDLDTIYEALNYLDEPDEQAKLCEIVKNWRTTETYLNYVFNTAKQSHAGKFQNTKKNNKLTQELSSSRNELARVTIWLQRICDKYLPNDENTPEA